MKKYITILAAATALILAGCNKNEMASDTLGGEQTVSLTLNATRGDDATKTSMTYNEEYGSLESVWKEGDKVYVYSRKSGEELGVLTVVPSSIVNQKTSATAQYATSYASFKGTVTLGESDTINDEMLFVYQGEGRSLSVNDNGFLIWEMGTSDDIDGLAAWDIATATGKIIGTADNASCAVDFSNKVGFGYFTTKGLHGQLLVRYATHYYFNVKTGLFYSVMGNIELPEDTAFYMPLFYSNVSMSTAEKVWSVNQDSSSPYYGKMGYSGGIRQSKSFTSVAGNYYRLGRNAATPFGPVAFEATDWTCYETLKNSEFNVGTEQKPKMVRFTQGNLQYIGSAATPYWRVAPTQYSYLEDANYRPTSSDSGTKMPLSAKTDLFGWGEVEPPFFCSNVNGDYQHGITTANMNLTTDWATKFNNGTSLYIEQDKEYDLLESGEKYICLTRTEWQNLLANQWSCGTTVRLNDGTEVKGVVICPSSFNETEAKNIIGASAAKGATRTPTALYSESSLTQEMVDSNGLLFLPAAGYRNGVSLKGVDSEVYYWATTSSSEAGGYRFNFAPQTFKVTNGNRYIGSSVRLATYAEPTETE